MKSIEEVNSQRELKVGQKIPGAGWEGLTGVIDQCEQSFCGKE